MAARTRNPRVHASDQPAPPNNGDRAPDAAEPPTTPAPPPVSVEPKPPPTEKPLPRFVRIAQESNDDDELGKAAWDYLQSVLPTTSGVSEKYHVLYLYDNGTMMESDADKIYAAAQKLDGERPILLVIQSFGGEIAPAYFISKICRIYAGTHQFAVAVPRKAKSAATLVCCGADEIHMGLMSELGPIDPQIERMPALGLKNAIDHIADLVRKHPAAAEMFAAYLTKSLPLSKLGYYERVAESAAQYAERLMLGRKVKVAKSAADVAKKLVYDYKDHGFVIDAREAETVFGPGTIQRNTPEYEFANAAYNALDVIGSFSSVFAKKKMYFIGVGPKGFNFIRAPDAD